MPLDYTRYRSFVEHFDLSDEGKFDLIDIVARVMASFVDRDFGEAPEQFLGIDRENDSAGEWSALESETNLQATFCNAADPLAGEKGRP